MANTTGAEKPVDAKATLEGLVANSKSFFAVVSTNDNYPAERRELVHKVAEYIRTETKSISDNRIFKVRTNREAYNASRLEYSEAADRLLDRDDERDVEFAIMDDLETLVTQHAEESIEFAEHVCSSYDTMVSMFRNLIAMEAVSETGGEPVDAGYLQSASYNIDAAGRALLQSAHRALVDDANEHKTLYAEMNAEFFEKFDGGTRPDGEKFIGYRQKADDGARTMVALLATSYQLCKDGKKVTPKKFDTLVEQYKTSMKPANPQAGVEFA